MAAGLTAARFGDLVHVESCGVYEGALDPFADAVMKEAGLDISGHVSRPFSAVNAEGFDLIVALTPEARAEAERLRPNGPIEYWDVANPSEERGARDAVMAAYRRTRDALEERILKRFA